MVKLIYCLHRVPRLSLAQFQDHWLGHHSQYGARMDGIRRYAQYHAVEPGSLGDALPDAPRRAMTPYDGVMNSWWDSVDGMRRVFRESPEMAAALADESRFIDHGRSVSLVAEEHVVTEPRRPAPIVVFECLRARPGLSPEEFRDAWLELGARRAGSSLAGLIHNVPLSAEEARIPEMDDLVERAPAPAWDGVAAVYLDSVAALMAYWASDEARAHLAREAELVDHARSVHVPTRRHVIVDVVR